MSEDPRERELRELRAHAQALEAGIDVAKKIVQDVSGDVLTLRNALRAEQTAHEKTLAEVARLEEERARILKTGNSWYPLRQRLVRAEAEVARLREELAKEQRLTRFTQTQARDELATERAAHEATRQWRDQFQNARDALSKRVAELERDRAAELEARGRYFPGLDAQTALSSARELLERVDAALENEGPWLVLQANLRDWLRAHPEPATPAATGAEHVYVCPACGKPSGSPPPAEKERG